MKKKMLPYLFMLPAILVLVFIYAGPVIGILFFSITDWNGVSFAFDFVGLKNYGNLFREKDLINAISNTLEFFILTFIFQNILALFVAVLLNKRFFGRNALRTVFFMPATISVIAVGLIWSLIFDPVSGAINVAANAFGWDWLAGVRFLGNTKIVMKAIAFVNIWQWAGWNMVIYIAGLQGIAPEYYEAARIDGAGDGKAFFHITLPLLAPAITINMVMTTIGGLKVFDLPFAMTGGGPGHASETFAMTIVKNSFSLYKAGYGCAMSVVMFVVILIITVIQNTVMSKMEERTIS